MFRSLTLANIKAIRDSIVLKKNYQWILLAAIVVLLLLVFVVIYTAFKRDAAKNATIAELIARSRDDSSTIVYLHGTNGDLIASNEAIVTNTRQMMQKVVNWDSIARQFKVPTKDLTQVITERTKADVTIKQDGDAVVYHGPDTSASCPPAITGLQYTFHNPWYVADTRLGTTAEDTGYLKLQAWDTLTAVETQGADGIHLKINHSNPFIKTTGMNDYRVQAPTGSRPYNVSLSIGYGLVPNKAGTPFFGVTVGKTIFSFGKRKP